MASFVLEVGTEELPSRFLPNLEEELKVRFFNELEKLGYDRVCVLSYSTPRRFVVFIPDIDPIQPMSEECIVGPSVHVAFDSNGKPTKAAEKFSESLGLTIDTLTYIENKKGKYLSGIRKKGGDKTSSLLGKLCEEILRSLYLPKRMRWEGSNGETFLRPVRWILSLFDDEVVFLTFCGVTSSNKTFGHRVHGLGPFDVFSAKSYFSILKDQGKVILERKERRQHIKQKGDELAATYSGFILWNDRLLEEVEGIVEHPYPLLGNIDPIFLELPQEVLLTSIEVHQKSFGLKNSNGELLAKFLTVLNMTPSNYELVKQGWERVLRARLMDAYFFWNSDIKQSFETWCAKLEKLTFLAPLGNMLQKTQRISNLCVWLSSKISGIDIKDAEEVGLLSKADLVSEMVKEFDSLQGIMGGIYANKQGKKASIGKALAEQYLPSGSDTDLPDTDLGSILSIADKIDTLVGCFGLHIIPTGTSDPYALRRYALGIIRIFFEKKYLFSLDELITEAWGNYSNINWKLSNIEVKEELNTFFMARLKNYFLLGYEVRMIDAVLAVPFDYIYYVKQRLELLNVLSKNTTFETIVFSFKRVINILNKSKKELYDDIHTWDQHLIVEDAERNMSEYVKMSGNSIAEAIIEEDITKGVTNIKKLAGLVDVFFENVMVMCDDKDLQINRLRLLRSVENIIKKVADFSLLQV